MRLPRTPNLPAGQRDSSPGWQAGEAPGQPPEPGLPARPLRVLAVDDEAPVVSLIQYMLRPFGHEVVGAATFQEAVQRLDTEPVAFDIVITDLILPDGSGWDVARLAKARSPHVRVVLLTGWDVPGNGAEHASAGVDAILQKPFRQKELLSALCRPAAAPEAGK